MPSRRQQGGADPAQDAEPDEQEVQKWIRYFLAERSITATNAAIAETFVSLQGSSNAAQLEARRRVHGQIPAPRPYRARGGPASSATRAPALTAIPEVPTQAAPIGNDEVHRRHVLLLREVLATRAQPGQAAEAVLADWLKEYPGLSRTSVTDYRGGRIKGKVGTKKREAIETAITESARKLGLPAPADSE